MGETEDANGNLIFSKEEHSLSFVCAIGSPCEGIFPKTFGFSPDYYLVFKMSNFGVLPKDSPYSYCHFETEFTIRLYGIPLDIFISLGLTLGTALISTVSVIAFAYYKDYKDRQRESSVEEFEDMFGGGGEKVPKGRPDSAGVASSAASSSSAKSGY